jgi:hypothetical protein
LSPFKGKFEISRRGAGAQGGRRIWNVCGSPPPPYPTTRVSVAVRELRTRRHFQTQDSYKAELEVSRYP